MNKDQKQISKIIKEYAISANVVYKQAKKDYKKGLEVARVLTHPTKEL